DGDHRISELLELHHAPGHTPGHQVLRIASGGSRALLSADTWNHPMQLAHPDWWAGSDDDQEGSTATRRALLEELLAQREQVVLHRLSCPALPPGPRRQRFQLVLEPVELQSLPQHEEPARDLQRSPARGVGYGDDVRCVDQLALERGAAGERRGNPLRDQALRDLLVLLAPRLGAGLVDLRR